MADESEEKNLPASQKKLADARRKGQTSNSKDFVSGFTLLAAVLYLLNQWPMMRDRLVGLIDVVSGSGVNQVIAVAAGEPGHARCTAPSMCW